MQELSLDRCLYLFEDCRFDVFLRAAGTHTYYCFYFVYLSLLEVSVFVCYSLNIFSQQLLKTRVFRAILLCVTPLCRRATLGTDLCGVLRAALGRALFTPRGQGSHAAWTGCYSFSSALLPKRPRVFFLAVGPAEGVMGTSFGPVLCCAQILFHPRAAAR